MREQKLSRSLQGLAVECFPDNPDVEWQALSYEHYKEITYVEAEATPATVGYPRFRFVVSWPGNEPEIVGCYCLDDGRWGLLFGNDPQAAASAPLPVQKQAGGCALLLLVPPVTAVFVRLLAFLY